MLGGSLSKHAPSGEILRFPRSRVCLVGAVAFALALTGCGSSGDEAVAPVSVNSEVAGEAARFQAAELDQLIKDNAPQGELVRQTESVIAAAAALEPGFRTQVLLDAARTVSGACSECETLLAGEIDRLRVDCVDVWNAGIDAERWTAPEGARGAQLSAGVASIDDERRSLCVYWFFDVAPNVIATIPLDGTKPLVPLPPDTFLQIRAEDVTSLEPDAGARRRIRADGTMFGPPLYTPG